VLRLHELVMTQVLEQKLLVIVALLLVDIEVRAVKVEETVRQFIASERPYRQLAIVTIKHAATRQSTCQTRAGWFGFNYNCCV